MILSNVAIVEALAKGLFFVDPPPSAEPTSDGTVLAGRVEGKSSLARCGLLVHFTAPTIHAGFSGKITLEMINLGPAHILLSPGMFICQLILEEVRGQPAGALTQFQNQTRPSGV